MFQTRGCGCKEKKKLLKKKKMEEKKDKNTLTLETVRKSRGENVLFFIERSIDNYVVIYEAVVVNGTLAGIDVYWTYSTNLGQKDTMSPEAKQHFFQPELIEKKDDKNTRYWELRIECIKNRTLTVHEKKGKFTVKCVMNQGKQKMNCRLERAFARMNMKLGFRSGVGYCVDVDCFGLFNGKEICNTIKQDEGTVNTDKIKQALGLGSWL